MKGLVILWWTPVCVDIIIVGKLEKLFLDSDAASWVRMNGEVRNMTWSIGEMAKLCGVSVRTLHYYDHIGLLCPETAADSGYRRYTAADVERMQQIVFYRELDFPLKDIHRILTDPQYDKGQALRRQRHLLQLKRQRVDTLLTLLEDALEGDRTMENLNDMDYETARQRYAEEAKARWGHTDAWAESQRREKGRTPAQQSALMEGMDDIFRRIAALRHGDPAGAEAQAAVAAWQAFITENFYHCSDEMLGGLGEMYGADERFRESMDRFGAGTTDFLRGAIAAKTAR